MNTIQVEVVSAEESIFSGEAEFVVLPGEVGELGVYLNHTHYEIGRASCRERV